MLDIILDTVIDALKILPFLFLAYLLMEYIEHKTTKKSQEAIKKAGRIGPFIGGILGVIPQCGFSVAATNFYAARIISLGTLFAVYLSTSDEMLPIMLSEAVPLQTIASILLVKFAIGVIAGFVIDGVVSIFSKKKEQEGKEEDHAMHIEEMCDHDHCDCEKGGILKSAIKHTLQILMFIVLLSFILNIVIAIIGEETLAGITSNQPILGPILACLIGLIPNCASSVLLTQLWLENMINVSTMIGGLLVNAGVGLLVLFRVNKKVKENFAIVFLLYLIGFISAIGLNAIGLNQWIIR